MSSSIESELGPILSRIGKQWLVEEVVEDVVEQVPGALRGTGGAQLRVLVAKRLKSRVTGRSSSVRQRDEVSWGRGRMSTGRVQALDRLVVDREVEDAEEVVRVLVDLRALALREHVLEVERVPAEALGEAPWASPAA